MYTMTKESFKKFVHKFLFFFFCFPLLGNREGKKKREVHKYKVQNALIKQETRTVAPAATSAIEDNDNKDDNDNNDNNNKNNEKVH